jgi:hypothetical protein
MVALVLRRRRAHVRDYGGLYVDVMRKFMKRGMLFRIDTRHEQNTAEIVSRAPWLAPELERFMTVYLSVRFGRNEQLCDDLRNARRELIGILNSRPGPKHPVDFSSASK